jgi:hypothetical protein
MAWQNADGLYQKFGGDYRNKAVNLARDLAEVFGQIKQAELDFDLTKIPAGTVSYSSDLNNDGTVDGFTEADFYLPINSSVLRVTLLTTVAATGGTSITVGTFQKTGTVISATNLLTATEGVIANMDTIGKRIYGAGALVSATAGTAGTGLVDAYVGITTAGTFTAGQGRILIDYITPLGDA